MQKLKRFAIPCLVLLFGCLFFGCLRDSGVDTVSEFPRSEDSGVADAIDPSDKNRAEKELGQLQSDFKTEFEKFETAIAEAEDQLAKQQIFRNENPVPQYLADLKRIANQFPQTGAGFDAAMELVSRSKADEKDTATLLLIENYAGRLNYTKVINSFLADLPNPQIEGWIKALIEFAPNPESEARAKLAMARYVDQIPSFRDGFLLNPHLMAKLPESVQTYLQRDRTTTEKEELEHWLMEVIDEHPDGHYRRGKSFKEYANSALFELNNLNVGQEAPEIVGKDLDGIEFRLSDYRGKIVMLDFWGHWCGPCRQMYPQEREMVKKLASAPFALIGMNSDSDLELAKEAVESEGLSWRHYWNGPEGTAGPLAQNWNVEAWPTVYLIDGNGVIRYKDVLGDKLHRAVEALLLEAGHEVSLTP